MNLLDVGREMVSWKEMVTNAYIAYISWLLAWSGLALLMQKLTTMLQHRPIIKLGEAIKCQGEWEITVIS